MQQREQAGIPILYSVHLKPCNKPNDNIISDKWSVMIKKCSYILHEIQLMRVTIDKQKNLEMRRQQQ